MNKGCSWKALDTCFWHKRERNLLFMGSGEIEKKKKSFQSAEFFQWSTNTGAERLGATLSHRDDKEGSIWPVLWWKPKRAKRDRLSASAIFRTVGHFYGRVQSLFCKMRGNAAATHSISRPWSFMPFHKLYAGAFKVSMLLLLYKAFFHAIASQ